MQPEHISQGLADEYAVGSLDREEERRIIIHTASCQPCRVLLRRAEATASALALTAPRRSPPRSMRKKVMRGAGLERPSPLRRAGGIARAVAGVAAVFVAIAAFTGMVWVRGQVHDLKGENNQLHAMVDEALSTKVELAAITRRLNAEEKASFEQSQQAKGDRDLLLAMLSPKSDVAEVYSTDDNATAIGRLIWNDDQKRVWFVADNLPARPSDQTYQLWVNAGGRYTSLGTFKPDSSGFARYVTSLPEGISSYDSAVVTIENAGGASQREGPSVFAADLSRFRH